MRTAQKIRLAMVDDHVLFREGLKDLLNSRRNMTVVAEAGDGKAALSLVTQYDLDVLLIDLRLPLMGGVAAIRRIKEIKPAMKIVVITMYEDADHIQEAVVAGADAVRSKMDSVDQVIQTIEDVFNGKKMYANSVVSKWKKEATDKNIEGLGLLTASEQQVLQELSKGHTNKILADELAVSEQTLKNHLNTIFRKMGVKSRLAAVRKGIEKKWISLS